MFEKLKPIKLNILVLNFLFLIALLTLGAISYLSYSQLKSLIEANLRVNHAYEVIGQIDASLYSFAEIEAEQRAYLVSGNKDFLKEIPIIKPKLDNYLKASLALTEDNHKQNERIHRYAALIEARLVLLHQVIDLKANNQLNTPEGLALFHRSSEISNEAKSLGQEIKSVEEVLLSERNRLTIRSAQIGSMLLIIGSTLGIIFLIIPFILANIELINRKIIEHKNRHTRTHLRQIIESAKDMIAALDSKNRFEIFNAAYQREFRQLFGKTLSIGMDINNILSDLPQNKQYLIDIWKSSLQADETVQVVEVEHEHGKRTYELSASQIKNEHNEIKGVVHTVCDITNRVIEHSKLQKSYEKLSEGMQALQLKNEQITLLVDMSDIMLAANSQEELSKIMAKFAHSLLTFSNGYLFIMHPSKNYLEKAARWGNPHTQESIITPERCWAIRLGRMHYIKKAEMELVCEHIDTSAKNLPAFICVPLMAQNDIYGLLYIEVSDSSFNLNEETRLIITAFAELTALALANVRLRENLRYQSIRDPLTGLYNRRYLEDALFKQIHQAERSQFPFALLMLDVDHFKKINDNYGHDAGDSALREIAKILEGHTRQSDIIARYGGEEFIIMLHNIDLDKAKKYAEKIRIAVSKLQIKYGAQPVVPITVSIGIAVFPTDSKNKEELIELADKALYVAKTSGRNKVVAISGTNKTPINQN
ncbi:diguanylate cyclase [Legionella jamestowniensis]|uniref:diguanylate cyclase n=1 Tax=Legionella jamestowniensis TaxID=455 RepID=A0A0W0UIV5_9GAMM|nr:diguanylate cyclase [Legionella jamestowniensis]KTD07639.1 sensor histidine kinase [Legionella jamestowniensis]SFL59880.1 diguanylate cyclase with GAF sensor [Legionella jamestowniensis DSM 19215]